MTDPDPLPTRVAEYVAENRGTTPNAVLASADLDESRREQVEHYLADTRYTFFKDDPENDAGGLRYDTVEWEDVADWDVWFRPAGLRNGIHQVISIPNCGSYVVGVRYFRHNWVHILNVSELHFPALSTTGTRIFNTCHIVVF